MNAPRIGVPQGSRSFRALSLPVYRRYWIGHMVSVLGSAVQHTAVLWLIYRLTGDKISLGIVTFLFQAPILFLGMLGGSLAENHDRRRLLIFYYIVLMVQSTVLAAVTVAGRATVTWIYGLCAMHGVVVAFEVPARQTFLKDLTGTSHLASGIALNSAAFNAGRMIGAPIAGLMIPFFGEQACFVFNVVTFLAVLLSLMTLPAVLPCSSPAIEARAPMGQVWAFCRNDPVARSIIPAVATLAFCGIPFFSLMAVYARDVYGRGPEAFGLLTGAAGLGAIAGALIAAARDGDRIRTADVRRGLTLYTLTMLGFVVGVPYEVAVLCSAGNGLALLYSLVQANQLLQTRSPESVRSRIISVYASLLIGLNPFGALLLGYLGDRWGVQAAVGLGTLAMASYQLKWWLADLVAPVPGAGPRPAPDGRLVAERRRGASSAVPEGIEP